MDPLLGDFAWKIYKGWKKQQWYNEYFLKNEGAFDNHVSWYIEYQTIAQLKVNIDQLNLIWKNYWKEELLYIPFLNKLIIILLFDIWEFMWNLKYLIQNNFFLDKQDKTDFIHWKIKLKNKKFQDTISKENLHTYQKIKYFRNLITHPGQFNHSLPKNKFDFPINYWNYLDNHIIPPWVMLTWRSNKDNLHMYVSSHVSSLDPVLTNSFQVFIKTDKKGKKTRHFYHNVKIWEENCLFNLSIKTINRVKEFLQNDLSKIN